MWSTHPRGKFHLGFTIAAIILTSPKAHEAKVGDSFYRQQLRHGFITPVTQEGKEGRDLIERVCPLIFLKDPEGRYPESNKGYPPRTVRSGPDAEGQGALGSIYRQARNSFLIQRSLD